MADQAAPRDYRDTLFLPETAFPMKAGLPLKEPEWIKRWDEEGLYQRLREAGKSKPKFVFHDGPPYANGNMHLGHAVNNMLKDFAVRTRQMLGFDADFVPGWDCHGLPIEWKVEEEFAAKGRKKGEVPAAEFRAACRAFAQKWIEVQKPQRRRFGIEADWANPYLTMSFEAEAAIAKEFMKVVKAGLVYRGSKPVMWSPVERTSLAEAEVEYHEKTSPMIWVKFPIAAGGDPSVSVVIWTTTPWTIPGNRAISFSKAISYGLYEVQSLEQGLAFAPWVQPGDRLAIADKLAEEVMKAAKAATFTRVADFHPQGVVCRHPLHAQGYGFKVPLLAGDHVTDDAGTGFVHTAPGHGADDFNVWIASGRSQADIPYTVDENGRLTKDAPGFEGLEILQLEGKNLGKDGAANKAVIEALIASGNLLARGLLKHSYPHSWRSKAPLIFRNTPQFFIALDKPFKPADAAGDAGEKTLRQRALAEIERVDWGSEAAQNRIRSMVADRPDWLISRQRNWGVPLAMFISKETGEILMDEAVNARIIAAMEAGGADAWFTRPAADFLGSDYNAEDFEKIEDILDVWFDSGSSHAFVLGKRATLPFPANLYLEGTDQHRGWFQSSLLESCATRGRAPFEQVRTHGFTVDEQGRKMSKSLGNGIEPEDIAKQSGLEILRLLLASVDAEEDQRLGKQTFDQIGESYRKLRNTMRYLLGAIAGFTAAESLPLGDETPLLERWLHHRLAEVDAEVRAGFEAYQVRRAVTAIVEFCNVDLSAFYVDVRKDALYCDRPDSLRRRACRTALEAVFDRLTAWLAPVLVFTADEAWRTRYPEADSVHLRVLPETPAAWLDAEAAETMARLRAVRSVITGALEAERREKRIGSSLEAQITVFVADAAEAAWFQGFDLAELAIVSAARVEAGEGPEGAFRAADRAGLAVLVAPAEGKRCARSWRVTLDVGQDPRYPELSARDADAVAFWDAGHGR